MVTRSPLSCGTAMKPVPMSYCTSVSETRTPAGVNTRWRSGICNDWPTMIAARPPSMVCTCCEMSRRLLLSDW